MNAEPTRIEKEIEKEQGNRETKEAVLSIRDLYKRYRVPILHRIQFLKKLPKNNTQKGFVDFDRHKLTDPGERKSRSFIEALNGVDLDIWRGEVIGFLGPNGAGKTTTIKIIMGLVAPTQGRVDILGKTVWDIPPFQKIKIGKKEYLIPFLREKRVIRNRVQTDAQQVIGYLPEQPYFYEYLRPQEVLDFYGRIFCLPTQERKKRIKDLIDMVGLGHATDRVLRKFSKGMLQRVGIAQALINDPEILILDEPLTGLDPIGRKEIRDLILQLKKRGKTIFLSSHILHDIELICDKVAFIVGGKIRRIGSIDELLGSGIQTEILIRGLTEEGRNLIADFMLVDESIGDIERIVIKKDHVQGCLRHVLDHRGEILSVSDKRDSLEDIFLRTAQYKTE
jgi:ABC-2 type transport system ATP-binding protein